MSASRSPSAKSLLIARSSGSPADVTISLQLADGSRYAHPGKFNFLDVTVNQGTDTVLVRATFANPDRHPGGRPARRRRRRGRQAERAIVVRRRLFSSTRPGAFVLVVDSDNKVQVRRVEIGGPRGTNMILRKGLAAGERVVTEGIQRVRPGQVVKPTEVKPGA